MANAQQLTQNAEQLGQMTQTLTDNLEQNGAGSFLNTQNLMNMQMMMGMAGSQSSTLSKFIPKVMMGSILSQALTGKPLDQAVSLIGTEEGEKILKERSNQITTLISGLLGAGTGAGADVVNFASNKFADGLDALNDKRPSPFLERMAGMLKGVVGEKGGEQAKASVKNFFESLKFEMEAEKGGQSAEQDTNEPTADQAAYDAAMEEGKLLKRQLDTQQQKIDNAAMRKKLSLQPEDLGIDAAATPDEKPTGTPDLAVDKVKSKLPHSRG